MVFVLTAQGNLFFNFLYFGSHDPHNPNATPYFVRGNFATEKISQKFLTYEKSKKPSQLNLIAKKIKNFNLDCISNRFKFSIFGILWINKSCIIEL
ncbi:hypothetical protein AN960_05515 [Bacillus sp. FJAT-25509]|nr:hypothetical protein AN960_05515 [Bacillus sp. FJAT-25509]